MKRAALVGLAVDGQHLGGDAMAFVDRCHSTGRIAALGQGERPQSIGVGEARRRLHERELEDLNDVRLDEHAGGFAGGVLHNLDALGWLRVAGDSRRLERRGIGDGVYGRLVPVAPDTADVHGMVGRGGVEIGAGGPALLGEPQRSVEVERRAPHRHRHDPLAAGPDDSEPSDHALDVDDGAAASERGIEELESLTVQVGMPVHEPRHDRCTAEVDDARAAVPPRSRVDPAPERDDPLAPDGERRRRRTPRIKREDAAVDEERVGGYSVAHLFCGADLSRTL